MRWPLSQASLPHQPHSSSNNAKVHIKEYERTQSVYWDIDPCKPPTSQMCCPCELPPFHIVWVQWVLDGAQTPQLRSRLKQGNAFVKCLPHFAHQITNLRSHAAGSACNRLQASTPGGGCAADGFPHPLTPGAQQLPPQPHWDCSSRGRRGLHPAAAPLTSCVSARSDSRYVESDPLPSLQAALHSSAALTPRRLGERPCNTKQSRVGILTLQPAHHTASAVSNKCPDNTWVYL